MAMNHRSEPHVAHHTWDVGDPGGGEEGVGSSAEIHRNGLVRFLLPSPFESWADRAVERFRPVSAGLNNRELGDQSRWKVR